MTLSLTLVYVIDDDIMPLVYASAIAQMVSHGRIL
jgi:hypothetical protein